MTAAYRQTLDYLYEQLPMFSKYGKGAIKHDLSNTIALCTALGHPEQKFRSLHIAGTNGKGSTSHMIAAILQQAGYKTGLYTSPHIFDFRERIRIDGQPVSEEWVTAFVDQYKDLLDEVAPSFFEATVAMAFQAFAQAEVDIAVIETGLGGRLDSTNVITPLLSVITNISYDHTDILGDSLRAIAQEKAGIIKPGVPFIVGQQQTETENIFFEHAVQKQCNSFYADACWALVRTGQDASYQYLKAVKPAEKLMFDLKTDLAGSYQLHNIKTALTAADVLRQIGFRIDTDTAIHALAQVRKLTGLRGRWEQVSQTPLVIADVAHNPAGLSEIMQQWAWVPARNKHIVTGFVRDKDIAASLALFPRDSIFHFCNAAIPRALPAEELIVLAAGQGINGTAYTSVAEAVKAARQQMSPEDALLITGSFFIVSEALL